jgi:hypothetical protein
MNDAQNWTIILGLLSSLWAVLVYLMTRLDSRFDQVDSRFDRLESKMDSGFSRLERHIDGLDRDVNILMRRHFGDT